MPRRYSEARNAFAEIQGKAAGDDRELIDLRIAESDFFRKRYQAARRSASPVRSTAPRAKRKRDSSR